MTEMFTSEKPGVLTPMATAIAGFTVATLSLLSNGAWALAIQALVTSNLLDSDFHQTVVAFGAVQTVLALLALGLGQHVLANASPANGARHLAGATLVVGGLGLLVGVVTIVAGLVAS